MLTTITNNKMDSADNNTVESLVKNDNIECLNI